MEVLVLCLEFKYSAKFPHISSTDQPQVKSQSVLATNADHFNEVTNQQETFNTMVSRDSGNCKKSDCYRNTQ